MPPDVLDLFLELAAAPEPARARSARSPTVVTRYLRDCGLERRRGRHAGPEIGSTMGNLYTRIEPTAEGEPLFLCAHLDTVPPTAAIEPVVEDGVVRNAAGTILGADNKAAVAAMLEATRRVLAEGRPHAGIELLFTPKEEVGLVGAYAFDHTRLRAQLGYVYDQAAPIGVVILGAPYSQSLEVTLPRARRAFGHASRRRPLGDRSQRRARSRRCGSAASTRTRPRTSARSRAAPRRTSSPSGARSSPRRARRTSASSPISCRRCRTRSRSPPASPSATSRRTLRKSYRGYRFAKSDRAVALAARRARALRARR